MLISVRKMLFLIVLWNDYVVSQDLKIMIKQMASSIKDNLTLTLPVETHVLIDPMVEEVVYYSYPILDAAKDRLINDSRVDKLSRIGKLELVREYAEEGSAQLIKELKARSYPHIEVNDYSSLRKRRTTIKSYVLGHLILFAALTVAGLYFISCAVNFLTSALDQATLIDDAYRSPWILNPN